MKRRLRDIKALVEVFPMCALALHNCASPLIPINAEGSLRWVNVICREGNGHPLQYSCLENPMDGGAWWAAVNGVSRSQTWLSDFTFTFHFSLSHIGEGNGNPLQYSCLENPRDRGAWWAAVYGVAQLDTTEVT